MQRYVDFDLEVYEYALETGREHVRVRALEWQKPGEAELVEFPAGLRQRVQQLERRDLDLAGLVRLGEDLAAILLPLRAREFFNLSLDRLAPEEGLRLRIRLGAWALADLPWEFAYVLPRATPADQKDAAGFLALNRRISVVRHETLGQALPGLEPVVGEPIRLTAFLADAIGTDQLDLGREAESIRRALEAQPRVEYEIYQAAGLADFQAALDRKAQIFHFAGHGRFDAEMGEAYGTIEGKGFLLFAGDEGRPEEVSAEELALNLAGSGVRLAVLAACEGGRRDGVQAWSGIAPALARAAIPAVVAMQYRVRDDKAVAFSSRFYESLATGNSVDAAVTAGRLAMFDSEEPYGRDWGIPVLYLRTEQTVLFPAPERLAAPKLARRFAANLGLTLVLAALAVAYFFLHLEPLWLRQGIFGATAIAVGSMVSAVIAKLAGREVEDWLRGLLGRRRTTGWLAAGCSALLLLSALTSSVFLLPGSFGGEVERAVVESDLGLGATFTSEEDRPVGKLLFGRLRPADVQFFVAEPVGYQLEPTRLLPGWSSRVPIPGRLQKRQLTLLRILPGLSLVRRVPRHDLEEPNRRYSLVVSGGGREPERIEDLRTAGLFLGPGEAEVRQALRQARAEGRLAAFLERRLADAGVNQAERPDLLRDWEGEPERPRIHPGPELSATAPIRIEVFDPAGQLVGCSMTTLDTLPGEGIKTILVERRNDC